MLIIVIGNYTRFLKVVFVSQSEITRRLEESSSWSNEVPQHEDGGLLQRSEISLGEHPLSLGKASVWNQFFQVLSKAG